jgi:phospholipid-translocating ATPase
MSIHYVTQTSLAPRFMVKFFTTVYTPLDKDIVREMWVKGDLKDQLGINHRKARKNPRGGKRNLEAAPMFQEQHSRSLSEISSVHDQYEPTMTSSPGTSDQAPRQTYLDTPPMSQATDLPIQGAQYVFTKSHLDQETHLSPVSPGDRNMNPSPHPSYYSVSELPPPSPMPSPKYKYPSGEITSTPPSRRTSVATTRASLRGTPQAPHAPMPLSPVSLHAPSSPHTLQLPGHQRQSIVGGTSSNPGAFEMRVQSPPNDHASNHSHGHAFERSASSASYTTAADDFYTAEDDFGSSYGHASGQRSPGYAHDAHSQQHGMPFDDDDRDTVVGHDSRRHDRDSNAASWEGPRAL